MSFPIGPEVDTTFRPRPTRTTIQGRHCVLEPLAALHAPALWEAAAGADASWTYLGYGPFATERVLAEFVEDFAARPDHFAWAVSPVAGGGRASGWLTLMDVQPENAAIELGNIWFAPRIQRTPAATEAMFLLLSLAADGLGYRRMTWKCNALNAASRRAADRLGFCYEGTLRAHMVVKGRLRDTAYYSIVSEEWSRCRGALKAWLDPGNFDADGMALQSLSRLRDKGLA